MTPPAHSRAAAVDEMLLDAGLEQDPGLRRALLAVGSLADLPVPDPSGQLAALLGTPVRQAQEDAPHHGSDSNTGSLGDELGRRRRLRAHRPTVVGLALVAGMGMGVGTVAASSSGPAHTGSLSVQQLLEDWSPSWTIPAPQATASGFLHIGSDDGDGGAEVGDGQDGNRLVGSETTLAEDPPLSLQQAPASVEAPASQPPGQGWEESGELPGADGQGGMDGQSGMKEPEKDGAAAEHMAASGPDQPAQGFSRGYGGYAPGAGNNSGQGAGPAQDPLTGSGKGVPGLDGTAAGDKPVPGAKWLEKFGR